MGDALPDVAREAEMMKRVFQAFALILSILALAPDAKADIYPQYPTFWTFPDCAAPFVEQRIIERSNWAERTTFHYGVEISGFQSPHERTVEAFGPSPIYRRYCRATAMMSDGRPRTIHYRISRGMGLAGTGYNVEFCIQGLDRWRVFDGNCRVLYR
jgi:hypothetical protein